MPTMNHSRGTVTHTVRLSDVINDLLAKGYSPRDVRLELSKRGIGWGYKFAGTQGRRERTRRLRQRGLKLCPCGTAFELRIEGAVCPACLVEKWAGIRPIGEEGVRAIV